MLNQEDYRTLSGRLLVGSDDEKLGKIDQLYTDREDGHPTFLTVSTGLFGSRTSFVPVNEASLAGDEVRVPYTKDRVKDGTMKTADRDVDTNATTTTAAAGRGQLGEDVRSRETDEAMTRSEERLSVGKEPGETARARLRKYIVTENVTQTVPVSREEVRIEREPITAANRDQAMSGANLSEEEHEVTLHGERAIVEKETVPVERVRLDKETITDEQQVSETLGKEQIEVDGAEHTRR
jgi:uncharacterized protein (TIGR02271 family)